MANTGIRFQKEGGKVHFSSHGRKRKSLGKTRVAECTLCRPLAEKILFNPPHDHNNGLIIEWSVLTSPPRMEKMPIENPIVPKRRCLNTQSGLTLTSENVVRALESSERARQEAVAAKEQRLERRRKLAEERGIKRMEQATGRAAKI